MITALISKQNLKSLILKETEGTYCLWKLAHSGVTGLNPGHMRFQDFWAYTLAWIERKSVWLVYYISYNWVWNINKTYVFIMKFNIPWSLLPESVAQFLTPLYQVFTKSIIRNVSWQNMSNFLSVVLKKFSVNLQQYLFICAVNGK